MVSYLYSWGGGVKLLLGENAPLHPLPQPPSETPPVLSNLYNMLQPILPYIYIILLYVGISLWELEVDRSSQYNAMQTNFHTFSVGGKTYAVQFAK